MPITVEHDGEEKEVYTKEEFEEAQGDDDRVSELEGELETAQSELEEAQEKLQKAEETANETDDEQVKRLRTERDNAQKEAKTLSEQLRSEIDEVKNTVSSSQTDRLLDQYAGNDQDKRKALKQEFESYRPDATSSEDIRSRMEKASKLVDFEVETRSVTDGKTTSGGGVNNDTSELNNGDNEEITENTKEQGKMLGISEEDYEKYGNNEDQ